jgi:hypothetical protein
MAQWRVGARLRKPADSAFFLGRIRIDPLCRCWRIQGRYEARNKIKEGEKSSGTTAVTNRRSLSNNNAYRPRLTRSFGAPHSGADPESVGTPPPSKAKAEDGGFATASPRLGRQTPRANAATSLQRMISPWPPAELRTASTSDDASGQRMVKRGAR